MTDEMTVVRALGAREPHADPAARERVRARVFADGGVRPARPRRLGRSVRVAAAAAAVLLLGGLVVVLGSGRSGDGRAGSAAAPSPTTAPNLFPAPDQYLYVRSKGAYLSCSEDVGHRACTLGPGRVREIWLSETRNGVLREGPASGGPGDIGHSSLYLGNRRFTHAELAVYAPTGPELLRELQAGRVPGQGNGGASYPFVQLTDALREAAMPPAVRRAIIEALPLVPGVTSLGEVRDPEGRPGLGFARTLPWSREEAIVDPVSLELLAEREILLDENAAPGSGLKAGDVMGGAVYLQRAVVDRAGERP